MKASRKKPLAEFSEYSFEFKVYGDELLRIALNAQYRYKCAYCETFYGASQPVAVEHYRPKGEIVEGDERVKPGYYWLAASWDNLCRAVRTATRDGARRRRAAQRAYAARATTSPSRRGAAARSGPATRSARTRCCCTRRRTTRSNIWSSW